MKLFFLYCFLLGATVLGFGEILRENLYQAEKGDYVVIAQGKTLTLLHIFDKFPQRIIVEEVTIAAPLACRYTTSWKNWLKEGAPQNSSWVLYHIDLQKGTLDNYYSFTKQGYFSVPQTENFLQTLLHLKLTPIPEASRKKVGLSSRDDPRKVRPLWQPTMVVEGQPIAHVSFDAYETIWPLDNSPISGKTLEIFIPKEKGVYPAYFPYWMQVKGVFGPAKVRIIDSGKGMVSPKILN